MGHSLPFPTLPHIFFGSAPLLRMMLKHTMLLAHSIQCSGYTRVHSSCLNLGFLHGLNMYVGCPDAIHTASLASSLKRYASLVLLVPHIWSTVHPPPFSSKPLLSPQRVSSVTLPLPPMVDPKHIIVPSSECNAFSASILYRSLGYPLFAIDEFRHLRDSRLFPCPTVDPSIIHPRFC